jgi:CubicO group peptidase (beta-lactamase class C family)
LISVKSLIRQQFEKGIAMRKIIDSILFMWITIFAIVIPAQSIPEKIDQLIQKYNEFNYFNGSALVANNFEVIFKKGYGFANVEWNISNDSETKHRLGSITKQFTSMLIMQLVEKGKIKLNGKITDYLPYYRKDTGDKVTIEMLLTHTSGIPSYTSREDFRDKVMRKFYKPDDFVKEYCSGNLEFEPGKQFLYNNSGYFILGAIIEHVTGKTYEEALQKNIFDPLGMQNSGFDRSEKILPKRAAGYERTITGLVNAPFLDMSLPYAAGSLYSTVEDLFLWDKTLQTERLISAGYRDEIFKGRVDAFGGKYAFGWSILKKNIGNEDCEVITHGGGINGFNTINYMVPNRGLVVILFSNAGGAPLGEITDKIINIIDGKEVKMPIKSIAQHLNTIINEEGIKEAVSQFKQLKEEKELFQLNEGDINKLGYEFMNGGKIDEAIEIFRLNTEEFSKSYNAFDSYAEALLKKGNKEEAIANYKKSLALNPRSQSGIAALKNLGVVVEEKKDAEVSEEVLMQYAGKYQLAPNFILTVTTKGRQIFTQATGQEQFEIFPESETKFYLKVVEAKVEFVKEAGKVTKLILFQNGRELPASKIE